MNIRKIEELLTHLCLKVSKSDYPGIFPESINFVTRDIANSHEDDLFLLMFLGKKGKGGLVSILLNGSERASDRILELNRSMQPVRFYLYNRVKPDHPIKGPLFLDEVLEISNNIELKENYSKPYLLLINFLVSIVRIGPALTEHYCRTLRAGEYYISVAPSGKENYVYVTLVDIKSRNIEIHNVLSFRDSSEVKSYYFIFNRINDHDHVEYNLVEEEEVEKCMAKIERLAKMRLVD